MRNAIEAAATAALASYDKHIKPYDVKKLEFARRFHVSSSPTALQGAGIYDYRFFGVAEDAYAHFPALGGFGIRSTNVSLIAQAYPA